MSVCADIKLSALLAVTFLSCHSVTAQNSAVTIDKNLIFRQDKTPDKVDNHNYTSFYSAGKDVYNLKNIPISHSSGEIIDFKVNPAGYSYAVLSGKGKKFRMTVYDSNKAGLTLAKVEDLVSPSAISYSPDSRWLYLADNGAVKKYSSRDLVFNKDFAIEGVPFRLLSDPLGMYIVCVDKDNVRIYTEEEGNLRRSLPFSSDVVDVVFSRSGDKLIILCADGTVQTYNTRDFSLIKRYADLGVPSSLSVHPEDKFISIATEGNRVQFLNLIDDFDRPFITDMTGPRKYARFVTDKNNNVFITYDADNALVYKRISGFAPNNTKLLLDQLNERMREWTKMRPMETEEEYRARVNPESIERQRRLFANEIATSLAGDLISHQSVTLGSYNPQNGLLTINIGGLPPIYLKVPQEDMPGFGDGLNLQFNNTIYGITPQDTYEVIYVDVYNPTNSKTYTFDNLDREDLSNLMTDDSFVSLDLIMKTNREDVMLKSIKDRIVEEAIANNLISEHTDINVDTRIIPAFDANGKSINNYRVAFDYTVDAEYSEHEDFPSGKYLIESSNAALSLIRIIKQAFDTEFSSYINSGKKLVVEFTGSADGSPIRRAIAYDGVLGEFDNEPVNINGELTSLSVSSNIGIATNEQLAFMRAQSVKQDLLRQLPQLENMDSDYRYNIEVSEGRGGEFRRVSVVLTFIDIE
ncbi:MAG: WD40 repeat domain-containing protein [Muribaculaceae bacterium]|nr:WD40 repeat domain-containing protein [Muribaculaceae bacterium]